MFKGERAKLFQIPFPYVLKGDIVNKLQRGSGDTIKAAKAFNGKYDKFQI